MSSTSPAESRSTGSPRVSVIIPHYNMPDALDRCLASVRAQAGAEAVEIIVVDNGSKALPHAVLARHPGVRLLSEPTPGPGPARNTGVAAAQGDVLLFIDADCRAAPGWLEAAIAAVSAGGTRAVVGGDVRVPFVDPARPTAIEAFEAVFGYRQQMYIERKGFSATCNMAMHRAVFDAVGPFSAIGLAEDLDWGRRAVAAGFAIAYVPAMRVHHPARPDFHSLQVKWQRHIAHDWAKHVADAEPRWRWRAKAAAMPLSVLVDAVRLLISPRLPGFGLPGLVARLRGIGVLARLRLYRAAEMRRVMAAGGGDAARHWQATT
jgi:GT2 family glycosyltransferase